MGTDRRPVVNRATARPAIPVGCRPNHWLTTVAIDDGWDVSPGDVLDALRAAGIEARHSFKPMHLQPVFGSNPVVGGAVADDLFRRSISLPSGSWMDDDTVDWICDVFASALERR